MASLFCVSPRKKPPLLLYLSTMKKARKPSPRQPSATALTIVRGAEKPLSKAQQEFNRLTARIEKLRKDFDRKQKQFDEALELYGKEVVPMNEKTARQSWELVQLLFPVYQSGKLPKTLQPYLKDMLQDYLDDVLQNIPGEPSAAVKEMFRHIFDERYETARKREEDQMKAEMEGMFKMWGVEVNMTDAELNEETMAERMSAVQEKIQQKMADEKTRWEKAQKTGRKTARQIEKEQARAAAEALKQKSISTIYRQLAKLLHPDLEQNETRRAEKEALMQEVTRAYEGRDLHALLLLELKWIHQEQNHLDTLADEKLNLYLQVLREQARNLEAEKNQLIHHPRYHVLLSQYGYPPMSYPLKKVKEDLVDLQQVHRSYALNIERLQETNPLPFVRKMVAHWKEEVDFENQQYALFEKLMTTGRWR